MAAMNCQVDIPKELTVGSEFHLICDGEWPADLARNKMELRLDEADAYKLKVLDFQMAAANKAVLLVTSYRPGEHSLKAVQIVDPTHSIVLGDLNFTVRSVLNPTEPETEPFGPMGPLVLSLPLWYYLVWTGFFAVLAFWIWVRVRRRLQRQKLLEEIRTHDSTLSPLHQFNQQLRSMRRNYSFLTQPETVKPGETREAISQMEKAYRVFLGRLLQVPALQWSDSLILKDIKRYHRKVYDECFLEMKKIFSETDRALKTQTELSPKDAIQIFDIARKTTDKINRVKNQNEAAP